jgi:hypothetical protein
MSLRSLTLLVLAVLLGTAASVRWYLQADQAPLQQQEALAPAPVPEHVPLPMWAEPARRPPAAVSTPGRPGVARRGQALSSQPAPPPPAASAEPTPGAFRPPLDPL